MTVYRKKDRWIAQPYINGKRPVPAKTFDTKVQAVKWERDTIANFNPEVEDHKQKTFDDLATRYQEIIHPTLRRGSVIKNDLELKKRIKPYFQHYRLQSITSEHWQAFLAHLTTLPLAPKSQRDTAALAASLFKKAEAWGWITRRPNLGIPIPKLDKQLYHWWENKDDIRRFLTTARETCPRYFPAFKLALESGMRIGEICGLSRKDVDLEMGRIQIHRQWLDVQHTFGPCKNGLIRTLNIETNGPLIQHLREAGKTSGHFEALFTTSTGRRIENRELYRRFQFCVKRAGVPRIRFHDLRHTYASHFMRNGGEIWVLAQVLGHADVQTTQRYAHHAKGAAQTMPIGLSDHYQITTKQQIDRP